jgi:hypothetical protein
MTSEFVEKREESYTYYNLDGSSEETSSTGSCAYSVKVNDLPEKYYIKFFRGSILDPYGMDSRKINSPLCVYKKVNITVFGYYSDYLTTKKGELLRRAERNYINV